MKKHASLTRRELLAGTLCLGTCPYAGGQVPPETEKRFSPTEPPNTPMGVGKGIHPGRVVWVHRPEATRWNGQPQDRTVEPGADGEWWDDKNCDPRIVGEMVSLALRGLTGQKTDKLAWDALFRHYNRTHGFGNTGYRSGEKITIKVNFNNDRPSEKNPNWISGRGLPSPQVVDSLLRQLIEEAGVPGKDVTVYDVANDRFISSPVYDRVRSRPNSNYRDITWLTSATKAGNGRIPPVADKTDPIRFSHKEIGYVLIPTHVVEAKYRINLALLRPHAIAGVTLTAKNNFGSIYWPDQDYWGPRPLHPYISKKLPMGSYSPFVDLVGHRQFGGKGLLYVIDGLYAARECELNLMRFASFKDHWTASVFMSQDPVAIDSVGLDFLAAEPRATYVTGYPDNFLHEAALADSPPSGTVYAPHGERLASLGVHEHWNNPVEKKYSRNLGKGEGIELVAL